MSEALKLLALRKDLLLARGALQRLRAQQHANALGRAAHDAPALLAAAATSRPARAAAFGLLVLFLGRGRLRRVLGAAGAALAVARLVRPLLSPARPRGEAPAARSRGSG